MRFFYLLTGLSFSSVAVAKSTDSAISTGDIISGILSLGLVLLSIVVCGWLLKKSRLSPVGGSQLKLVSNLALGTRERILVIEAGDQQYLIGVTSQQISLLDKLDVPLSASSKPIASGFAKQLNRIIKGDNV